MKNLFLLLFLCTMFKLQAQQQYNCYHLQEFMWNSQTEKYDKPIEKNEKSIFKTDPVNKTFIQVFEDGTSMDYKTLNDSFDKERGVHTFEIISPSNGYHYTYQVNAKHHVIEVSFFQKGEETLLKRYLYKD